MIFQAMFSWKSNEIILNEKKNTYYYSFFVHENIFTSTIYLFPYCLLH